MSTTLVLNADAQPVSVVPLSTVHWQDAIRIIYLERATVLAEYNRWVVRSPSVQMRMPSVIMLSEYQTHNGKVEFSRYNVILRDNYTCQYCGSRFEKPQLTLDHVTPKSRGGRTTWENVVLACISCNARKGNRTPYEAGFKPLRTPARPNWATFMSRRLARTQISSWRKFLIPAGKGGNGTSRGNGTG